MKIKELANKTGISPRMIRYYEEQGLLSPKRTMSGYREFNSRDLLIIQNIIELQEAGLTLNAVRVLMPCVVNQSLIISPCPLMIKTLKQQKEKLRVNFEETSRALHLIDSYLLESQKLVR